MAIEKRILVGETVLDTDTSREVEWYEKYIDDKLNQNREKYERHGYVVIPLMQPIDGAVVDELIRRYGKAGWALHFQYNNDDLRHEFYLT